MTALRWWVDGLPHPFGMPLRWQPWGNPARCNYVVRGSQLLNILDCRVLAVHRSILDIGIVACRMMRLRRRMLEIRGVFCPELRLRCSTLDIGSVMSRLLHMRPWLLRRSRVGRAARSTYERTAIN